MTDLTGPQHELLTLTADIVSSHVSNNTVAVSDLPNLIQNVFSSLSQLAEPKTPETPKQEPAVSIRSSVKPDYIVCLDDGKKLKMLKRHLMTTYNMTPDEYRKKWNLPADYPMVAPNYAQQRRNLAVSIGLGRKARAPVEAAPVADTPTEQPAMARGRTRAAADAEKAAPKKAGRRKAAASAAAE